MLGKQFFTRLTDSFKFLFGYRISHDKFNTTEIVKVLKTDERYYIECDNALIYYDNVINSERPFQRINKDGVGNWYTEKDTEFYLNLNKKKFKIKMKEELI